MLHSHIKECGMDFKILKEAYIVPKVELIDRILQKLFYNDIEWKRIWRHSLVENAKNGTHCFMVLEKGKKQ